MGAVFMSFGLLGSAIWIAIFWRTHPLSLWSMAWHVVAVALAAATVGKVLGITLYRARAYLDRRLGRRQRLRSP
jgi:hypothetical protein